METLKFSVNANAILLEAVEMCRHTNGDPVAGMWNGIGLIRSILAKISQRAIELEDPELLEHLERLGCIHAVEPPENNPRPSGG